MSESHTETTSPGGVADALRRGQLLLQRWVRQGEFITEHELAAAWSVPEDLVRQACHRGELFAVELDGEKWYWAGLAGLPRADVSAVCQIQRPLDPAEQLVFWMRGHGGIGGQTVVESLEAGNISRVLELAQAWVDERVGPGTD